jgi:hypothetical protein
LIAFALSPATAEARLFGSKEKKARTATTTTRSPGAFFGVFTKPNCALPWTGWEFPRKEVKPGGFFFGNPKPLPEMMQLIPVILARGEHIARFGLTYKFCGDHCSEGGMDCSGTMQFLLSEIGFNNILRMSCHEYEWLKKNRTLNHSGGDGRR